MFDYHFDMFMFQTAQDDTREQEAAKPRHPSLLSQLLAGIGSMLFAADPESSVQDDEVTAPQQPEPDPVSYYAIYFPEYYDVGLYWFDF
jgi:hypothetical protein